ncbi:MAG: hypothetical protein V4490_02590, partial [Pseudomonadota bacterium]
MWDNIKRIGLTDSVKLARLVGIATVMGLCPYAAHAEWLDWKLGEIYIGSAAGVSHVHQSSNTNLAISSLITTTGTQTSSQFAYRLFG